MDRNQIQLEVKNFGSYGYLKCKIPTDLFKSIKEECKTAQKENKKFISGLTGHGVPNHYYLNDKNTNELNKFLDALHQLYDKQFFPPWHIGALTQQVPLFFNRPWINFQKKHEFIPNHTHDGVYSYALWVNIPYDYVDEKKYGEGGHASTFEFTFNDQLGKIRNYRIELSKKDEGTIVFFPAKMVHCVYPFYTSNKTRISISGNIQLDTGKVDGY